MNIKPDKQKILVVDDMPVNLRVLKSILVDEYSLIVTTDSRVVVDMARTHRPDLILLDILMPEMDGYEVCRRLKADLETQDIPVIFVTSMSDAGDEVQGFAEGAVDYISKPFRPAVVLARVNIHLKMRAMHQALIRQNAALLEADQLKADMERITRHDLKTPIAGIVGCAALIQKSPTWADTLSPELRRFLQLIEDAGRHAMEMISRSLDMYKIERGHYQLVPQAVDLVSLIGKLTLNHTELAQRKTNTIEIWLPGRLATETDRFEVVGEEMLCYSLFSNLIQNAVEASPAHMPITVSLGVCEGMATIAIHNAGTVPDTIRERFFDKYVTAGKGSGTGLGTYSARLMAEVQGGRIHMESAEAHGTTVTVYLPMPSES